MIYPNKKRLSLLENGKRNNRFCRFCRDEKASFHGTTQLHGVLTNAASCSIVYKMLLLVTGPPLHAADPASPSRQNRSDLHSEAMS